MTTTPHYTTAAVPKWYIPLNQDADRVEREGKEALAERQAQLDAKIRALDPGANVSDEQRAELDAERRNIADAAEILRVKVEGIRRRYPVAQRFLLRVPTGMERDQIQARLIELGVRQVSVEQQRAVMVDELWSVSWDGHPIGSAENDAAAEAHANFLDGAWQRQEIQENAEAEWREIEAQRVADIMHGAPHVDPQPFPVKIISVRDTARLSLLVDRMLQESTRLRRLAGEQNDFARRSMIVHARNQIMDIDGFDKGMVVEIDHRTGAATEASINALREAVDDVSWLDVLDHIAGLFRVSGDEEKNSDWRPENPPPPISSPAQSDAQAINDGTPMASRTEPTPGEGYATTTDRSSISSTVPDGHSVTATRPFPTDGRYLTSPFAS